MNGRAITREALARYTGALARERGRIDLDPAEQRRILARLIDEEVLLQYGIALGLDRSEPSARRAIVSAVVDSLTTAAMREPERAELEAFYRERRQSFARSGRCRSNSRWCRWVRSPRTRRNGVPARSRSARAPRESLTALGRELGAALDPPPPSGPTATDALRDRFGGIVVQALTRLAPGETSDPVRAMDGYWVGESSRAKRASSAARRRPRRRPPGVDPAAPRRAAPAGDRRVARERVDRDRGPGAGGGRGERAVSAEGCVRRGGRDVRPRTSSSGPRRSFAPVRSRPPAECSPNLPLAPLEATTGSRMRGRAPTPPGALRPLRTAAALQCRRRFAHVPDQADGREGAQDVVGDVDLPPAEALAPLDW